MDNMTKEDLDKFRWKTLIFVIREDDCFTLKQRLPRSEQPTADT